MIKITNKTYYALKFLIHLSEAYPTQHLSVADVASKENISDKFLESIVGQLKSKGIVKAKRGAGGGYYLSQHPSQVTLLSVIEAVESEQPNLSLEEINDTHTGYVIRQQLIEIDRIVANYLRNKTIFDLQQEFDQLQTGQMFYI